MRPKQDLNHLTTKEWSVLFYLNFIVNFIFILCIKDLKLLLFFFFLYFFFPHSVPQEILEQLSLVFPLVYLFFCYFSHKQPDLCFVWSTCFMEIYGY